MVARLLTANMRAIVILIAAVLVIDFLDASPWHLSESSPSNWWSSLVVYLMGDANRIQLTPVFACNAIYEIASDSEGIRVAPTTSLWAVYGIVWSAYCCVLAIQCFFGRGSLIPATNRSALVAALTQLVCAALTFLIIAERFRCVLELKPDLLRDGWLMLLIPPILLGHAAAALAGSLSLLAAKISRRQRPAASQY